MDASKFPFPTSGDTPEQRLAARVVGVVGSRGIPCLRVSSAKARGRAKRYAYWGVARYRLIISRGRPVLRAELSADSERRSIRLANADAERRAKRERAVIIWETAQSISWERAAEIVDAYQSGRIEA